MTDIAERVHLRPGRALVQGVPHMFDFMGVLSRNTRTRSAEEDMALAWREVLSVVKPPPPPAGSVSPRSRNSTPAKVLRPVDS